MLAGSTFNADRHHDQQQQLRSFWLSLGLSLRLYQCDRMQYSAIVKESVSSKG
jgi:hypothetical protein